MRRRNEKVSTPQGLRLRRSRRSASAPQRLAARFGVGSTLALIAVWEAARSGWVSANLLPPSSDLLRLFRAQPAASSACAAAAHASRPASLSALLAPLVARYRPSRELGLSRSDFPGLARSRRWPAPLLLLLWLLSRGAEDHADRDRRLPCVYLNLSQASRTDRKLVEVGGIFGLKGWRLIVRIFLPASLPNLLTGLRSGLSLAWMFLVAAELIAATRGLGYLLTDGRETARADLVIVAIVVLALLGKLSDSLLQLAERRLLAWRDVYDSGR